MNAPDVFQLDLLTLVQRLRQIQQEGGSSLGEFLLWERVITCDLPRMEKYINPETIEWAGIRRWQAGTEEAGMRTFIGYRPQPPQEYVDKGITNSGHKPDYEGIIFSDGTVVIRWQTEFRSHSVWGSWDSFYQVHGHPEYGTVIEFADGGDMPQPPPPVKQEGPFF